MAINDHRERRRGELDYPLHKAVFENDVKLVSKLLKTHDVGLKDIHGKKMIQS